MRRIFILLVLAFPLMALADVTESDVEGSGPPPNCIHLVGTSGNDLLRGSEFCDWLEGQNGSDRLEGRAAGDWEYGGKDNDVILGEGGPDRLFAGCRFGLCDAGLNNFLYGGKGNDHLAARNSSGTDTLDGGDGYDICVGNKYDDYVGCEEVHRG